MELTGLNRAKLLLLTNRMLLDIIVLLGNKYNYRDQNEKS